MVACTCGANRHASPSRRHRGGEDIPDNDMGTMDSTFSGGYLLLCAQLIICLTHGTSVCDAFAASASPNAKPNILICDVQASLRDYLDGYNARGSAVIHHIAADDEGLACRLEKGDIDAFIVRSSNSVSYELVKRLPPKTRVIGRAGVGIDNIDLEACRDANIPVVTAAGASAVAVAEHTLGLMLAVARRIKPAAKSIEQGQWLRPTLTGTGLRGKMVGVVGFGAIGKEFTKMCISLGMKVLVAPTMESRSLSANVMEDRIQGITQAGAEAAESLNELLRRSDFISIHLPLTDETKHFIGKEELALMKKTAVLVSTGRGGVVDEKALLDSMQSGKIAGAALDVFESEGPQCSQDKVLMELARLDSAIVVPHLGGHTEESQAAVWDCVMERVLMELNQSQN